MVGGPAYGWVPKDGSAVDGWVDDGLCFLFLFFCFGGCDSSDCGLIFIGCDGLMLVGGGGCGLILVVLFFCFFWWLWPQQFF